VVEKFESYVEAKKSEEEKAKNSIKETREQGTQVNDPPIGKKKPENTPTTRIQALAKFLGQP
jgi:hypothetical protein